MNTEELDPGKVFGQGWEEYAAHRSEVFRRHRLVSGIHQRDVSRAPRLSGYHLVVREHQTIRLAPKGPLSRSAHAAFLARIPALPSGVLKPVHEGLRTSSHCGLIQAGPWTLEILPKIYDPEHPLPDRCALVRMLATCFDIPIWLDGTARSNLADDLLTVVIRAFLEEAQRQLRQGWIKSYVDQEDRLTRLRGRLNLSEQVRRGRAAADRLHCVFDELTVDNDFNRLVRAALVLARRPTPAWFPASDPSQSTRSGPRRR